jgi:hypothetical protein
MRSKPALASYGMTAFVLLVASLSGAGRGGREQEPASEYIAFRFDATHVIATLKVLDGGRQVREGLSPEPIGRYGYRYFEPSKALLDKVPAHAQSAASWLVHAAPGRSFNAIAERVVGGNPGCMDAVGVLLRVATDDARAFAALPARYFVAEAPAHTTSSVNAPSSVGIVMNVATPSELESTLHTLLARELPRVRDEARANLERMEASPVSYHRSWARQRKQIENALARGRGKLTYDVQAFQLNPDGVPLYFVRARWHVDGLLGFAASLWLRGEQKPVILQSDLRPASWLRMFMFQGRLAPSKLGLVLNVTDRDNDGWGEILFAQEGYESVGIQLLEYSPSGFVPSGVSYSHGC